MYHTCVLLELILTCSVSDRLSWRPEIFILIFGFVVLQYHSKIRQMFFTNWPLGAVMWTVYCPFWVWKLLTLVFTDDDDEEDDELEFGSMLCSFFLSFSMCFSSRAAILSPRPLWDRVFLSRTAWASLRLLHKIYKIHSQSVYNTHITAVLNIQWLCWGSTHCWLFGVFFFASLRFWYWKCKRYQYTLSTWPAVQYRRNTLLQLL